MACVLFQIVELLELSGNFFRSEDVATLSAGLFDALRELDRPDINRVYARCPVGGGLAFAVQNRLKKAAGFHIIDAEELE